MRVFTQQTGNHHYMKPVYRSITSFLCAEDDSDVIEWQHKQKGNRYHPETGLYFHSKMFSKNIHDSVEETWAKNSFTYFKLDWKEASAKMFTYLWPPFTKGLVPLWMPHLLWERRRVHPQQESLSLSIVCSRAVLKTARLMLSLLCVGLTCQGMSEDTDWIQVLFLVKETEHRLQIQERMSDEGVYFSLFLWFLDPLYRDATI